VTALVTPILSPEVGEGSGLTASPGGADAGEQAGQAALEASWRAARRHLANPKTRAQLEAKLAELDTRRPAPQAIPVEVEQVLGRLVDALALIERQARQIRMLRRVATDEVPHLHRRECPARWRFDELGRLDFDTRDPYCPACRVLIDTDGAQP
jgi:hypothetical protein